LTAAFQIAKQETRKVEQQNANRMNKVANEQSFKNGDIVITKKFVRTKMAHQNLGYYQVVQVKNPVLYLKHLFDGRLKILNVSKCRKVPESTKIIDTYPGITPVEAEAVDRFINMNLRHRSEPTPKVTAKQSNRLTDGARIRRHPVDSTPLPDLTINNTAVTQIETNPLIDSATIENTSNIRLRNQQRTDIRRSSTKSQTGVKLSPIKETDILPRDIVSDAEFNIQDIASQSTPITHQQKKEVVKGARVRQHCRYNLRRKPKQVQRYGDFVEY
jgi:hypothetical protein